MFSFLKSKQKQKIFVIGLGKTGTTTMDVLLKEFGFRMGNQRQGEKLLENWYKRDFDPILQLTKTADAFQDVPFGLPYTFQVLHGHYPDAKFILTLRDSAEQWADSLIRFHSTIFADGQRVPTVDDLKNANYIFKGRAYLANRWIYNTPENDPYNRDCLIRFYQTHEAQVRHYFQSIPESFISINVSNSDDFPVLTSFLNVKTTRKNFPWENKS